jgi:hypothetical protein
VPRAIDTAKKKAAAAGVSPRLMVGDVTRLTELGIGAGYNLLLDLGCFHSIPDAGRDAYVRGASTAASSGATMLLFGFIRREKSTRFGPRGLAHNEVGDRFTDGWELVHELPGQPIAGYDAAWYTLHRR